MATGCDNVAWGGMEMELRPPPTTQVEGVEGDEPTGENAAPRVLGPALLAGTRTGSRATLAVVGEIHGDSLAPFPNPRFPEDSLRLSESMSVGSEWILFSQGVRVGRLTADSVATLPETCASRRSVSGVLELIPEASTAERFIALSRAEAAARGFGEYEAIQRDYDQGVASLNIVAEVLPRVGATWPDQGTLASREDIQAFQIPELTGQAVAASFVVSDELAIAPPRQGAYTVFLIAQARGSAYEEVYAWYRAVDIDGKGAPRYFDHLDWDGDGDSEILLDVFGSNRRWYAALGQREGEWVRTFQDGCGAGSSSGE